jgi:AAA family ATP:ADP antiporter
MANPLKNVMNIRREELPQALLMSVYFFLVITSFWILKPIKKWLFIGYYDQTGFTLFNWQMTASQAELLAKVLNMIVAFLAVVVFTVLARKFRRQQLTYIFSLFFMICYALYSTAINNPAGWTVWSFYLFGDLFSTLMVATFFAFLNDSVTPEAAKRLYGLVGLGGVVGGAFGSSFVSIRIRGMVESAQRGAQEAASMSSWLWICLIIAVLIIGIAFAAGRLVRKRPPAETGAHRDNDAAERVSTNPALEGAKLVFRSKYLLSIVGIVGLYEIASTVLDFQFTATIAHYLDGPEIGAQFSLIYTITNWTSMFVQLFLTSLIMTRFGVTAALLVLPISVLAGSGAFMAVPILWVGSFLNTADNGFSYSINQSAKEALYVPTSRDEKYKAKAFIDMFVQRFAKALAVGLSLLITTLFTDFSTIRWLSILTFIAVIIWYFAVRYAGRKFRETEA